MAEPPYNDEERSLARVLGVEVQRLRVGRTAQALEYAFRKKFVSANVTVGKVYMGPNNEPKVEVSLSSDAALHLASLLTEKTGEVE